MSSGTWFHINWNAVPYDMEQESQSTVTRQHH